MAKYKITLEVESDTPIDQWLFEDRLIIDEPYEVKEWEELV